jgi:hypothetical protein
VNLIAVKVVVIFQALFPNFIARLVNFVSRLLPKMPMRGGFIVRSGWESGSNVSPSILTWLADRATERFNEARGHVPL